MVCYVLIMKTVLAIRLKTYVTLEDLEVRYQVFCLTRYLIVLLDYQLILNGVEVDQFNFRETKTAESFEHEIRDKIGNAFTANRNDLRHNPPGHRINDSHELQNTLLSTEASLSATDLAEPPGVAVYGHPHCPPYEILFGSGPALTFLLTLGLCVVTHPLLRYCRRLSDCHSTYLRLVI